MNVYTVGKYTSQQLSVDTHSLGRRKHIFRNGRGEIQEQKSISLLDALLRINLDVLQPVEERRR